MKTTSKPPAHTDSSRRERVTGYPTDCPGCGITLGKQAEKTHICRYADVVRFKRGKRSTSAQDGAMNRQYNGPPAPFFGERLRVGFEEEDRKDSPHLPHKMPIDERGLTAPQNPAPPGPEYTNLNPKPITGKAKKRVSQ